MDTSKNSLDAVGICTIIKACDEHKVSTLKFGDLEISFGPKAENQPIQGEVKSPPAPVLTYYQKPEAEISEAQHKLNNEEGLRQAELELREQQIEELLITDPRRAEELLENGDLEDADDESGDDE